MEDDGAPRQQSARALKRSLLDDQDTAAPQASLEMAPEEVPTAGGTNDAEIAVDALVLDTGPSGLSGEEASRRLSQYGRNELPDARVPKWRLFLSHFTGIMPGMIILAAFIEGLLQAWPDFWTLLSLLFLNGAVGFWEDMRAGDAVAALKASLKPEAQVKRDGTWTKIDAALLVPGDRVALASGANVPADCRVGPGMEIQVDQAALTGESLPVSMGEGGICKMGSTVVAGEVEGLVASTGIHTFFGKTAALIGSTHDVGHFQTVILRITRALLITSSILVVVAVTYLCVRDIGQAWQAVGFGVVLLVASIPIAMQVVCTATMALGSRLLAAQRAIVARLSSIEQLAGMNVLCSDKTGTLTLNKMVLQELLSYADDVDATAVLTLAALATKWHEPPKDALDTLVLHAPALDRAGLDRYEQLDFTPFDPTRKRTEATLRGPDGATFRVIKGAPDIVLGLCDASNRAAVAGGFEAKVEELALRGIRALAVARSDESGPTAMMGLLTFLDPPRPDTKQTIARAMMQGVAVKMITGDHQAIAQETGRTLGLGDRIETPHRLPTLVAGEAPPATLGRDFGPMIEEADGFAQVFPEHKFLIIESLRQRGWRVGMTGDGVNDAPALKKADVGIAVEGATDAARAAADLVLTAPGLSVIVDAIVISRCIFQRMKNYVIYRVACTIQLLLFFFFAVFAFHPRQYDAAFQALPNHPYVVQLPLEAPIPANLSTNMTYGFRMTEAEIGLSIPTTFNLPVLALVVIVILNDATIISIAYDHVQPSALPERWNLPVLFVVAGWIGLVACGSSLLLLHWALSSEDPSSPIRALGCAESLSYGQVLAMMYLKISLSDWWTIFAARTQGPFYSRKPSRLVFAAASLATALSTLLSVAWPFGHLRFSQQLYEKGVDQPDAQLIGLRADHVLFTWLYTLFWFLVQDACKVVCYRLLHYFDVCGIQTEAAANRERTAKNRLLLQAEQHQQDQQAEVEPAREGELTTVSTYEPV